MAAIVIGHHLGSKRQTYGEGYHEEIEISMGYREEHGFL
jgi:hypothetical protein